MDFAISFIAILAIALFFVSRFKLNPSVSPFFSIALITVFMCFMSTLGLVFAAGIVVFAAALFALIYIFVLKRSELSENFRAFMSPGVVFFILSGIFFFVALSIKNPCFKVWDEFSFWGTAAKCVFENRQIYTLVESSMANISYPPALPVFSFFIQFFARAFSEWKVYLAYDVMMMSVMAMLFSRIKWKNVLSVAVVSAFGFLALYLLWWVFDGRVLYCNSYGDIPVGVVFAGALFSYFYSEEKGFMKWFVTLSGLMLLPLVKDFGLALALVAAGIISVDMLISENYPSTRVLGREKKALRLVYPMLLFAGVLVSYSIWSMFFKLATTIDRVTIGYEFSALEILTGKDPYFLEILKRMFAALSTVQVVTFGTISEMAIVLTAVPIAVGVITLDRKKFLRLLSFSVLMLAGFALYYLFFAYLYTAIIHHTADYTLTDLPRYMSSYCSGWLLASVGICLFEVAAPKWKKLNLAVGTAAAAVFIAALFWFSPVHPDQYIFTSHKLELSDLGVRGTIREFTKRFGGAFTVEDRIYFICQESDDGERFLFNYEMMPAYTVQTYGTGNFVAMDSAADGYYDVRTDRTIFENYLREEQVDLVFVFKVNDYFVQEFGPMFNDNLTGFFDGSVHFYMVIDDGAHITLEPVNHASHLNELRAQYGKE